jgi:hypothetical protein
VVWGLRYGTVRHGFCCCDPLRKVAIEKKWLSHRCRSEDDATERSAKSRCFRLS